MNTAHWDRTQQQVPKPSSLLHPSDAFSSHWNYSVVKLLKEGGINPEAFASQKNNSKGKRKVVSDRETLSFWHNKPPEPRACGQEQWAMIFRFWNIYFCRISFQIIHCRSELISHVQRLTLVQSRSLQRNANVLLDSYSTRASPCLPLSATRLFPGLILFAQSCRQEQRMLCTAIAQKARHPIKDIAEVSVEAWQHRLARGSADAAEAAR